MNEQTKSELKTEVKTETTTEVKPDAPIETKQEVKAEVKQETAPMVRPQRNDIPITDQGIMQAKSFEDLYRISKMLCTSGMLPKAYDTPEKTMSAMAMIRELGLQPINALKNLAVINGTPTLYGELPLAMVRNSGQLESINEFLIDKSYAPISFENKNLDAEIFAAICMIKRKGHEVKTFHYTKMDMEKNPNSKNAVWSSYRAIMMKRKARSIALKDEFGDVLGGMCIAEYDYDVIPKPGENLTIDHNNENPDTKKMTDLLNDKLRAKSE